ncbi:MAG: DHHA1 domain-containing protein [Nanoarchaeota archaeon]
MSNKEIDFKFSAGSNDKFLKFVKNLNSKDRVALISHTDLDGLTSCKVNYKVVSQIVKPKLIKLVGYDEINSNLIRELKARKINKVIFSDLSVDDIQIVKKIGLFADILLIDHHLFNEDFNSNKITFINVQGECAAYLCYKLFSQVDKNKILDKIDWLVAVACIGDWQYFNNQEFMKKIFLKYGDKFEIIKNDHGEIRKSGKFWDLQWELVLSLIYFKDNLKKAFDMLKDNFEDIKNLRKKAEIIKAEIKKQLNNFENEKELFEGVYFCVLKKEKYPVRSIVATLSSVKYRDKTILILYKKGNKYIISARRADKKINVKEFLGEILKDFRGSFSGGHAAAGGGHILIGDLDKFKEKLRKYSS